MNKQNSKKMTKTNRQKTSNSFSPKKNILDLNLMSQLNNNMSKFNKPNRPY